MEKVFVTTNGRGAKCAEWRPSVPMAVEPGIAKEYYNHGLRMYLTNDGRKFDADKYDSIFKVKRGKVLPRGSNGAGIGSASW